MEMVKEQKPKKTKKKSVVPKDKIEDVKKIISKEYTETSEKVKFRTEEKIFPCDLNEISKSSDKDSLCDNSKSKKEHYFEDNSTSVKKDKAEILLLNMPVSESAVDSNDANTLLNQKYDANVLSTFSSLNEDQNERNLQIGSKTIASNKTDTESFIEPLNKAYTEAIVLEKSRSINVANMYPNLKSLNAHTETIETSNSINVANMYPNLKSLSHREKLEAIHFLHSQTSAYKEEYKRHLLVEANQKYQEFCNNIHGIENDHFFGLIDDYQKARKSSLELQSQIKYLNSNLKRKKESLWYNDKKEVSKKGRCRDGYSVAVSHVYEIKVLDAEKFNEVLSHLKRLEECIQSNVYFVYTKQLMELKIEHYLHSVINDSKNFSE